MRVRVPWYLAIILASVAVWMLNGPAYAFIVAATALAFTAVMELA